MPAPSDAALLPQTVLAAAAGAAACAAALLAAAGLWLWTYVRREELAFAIRGHAWTLHTAVAVATLALPPAAENVAGIAPTYIMANPYNMKRVALLRAHLGRWGITPIVRDQWDRRRVLRDNATTRRLWRHFATVTPGETVQVLATRRWDPPLWHYIWAGATIPSKNVTLRGNTLGCFANLVNHWDTWRDIGRGTDEVALILEDDALATPLFARLFPSVVREALALRPRFDVVFIGGCLGKHAGQQSRGSPAMRVSRHLWLVREHRCANAYLISRSAARRLSATGWRHVDVWLNVDNVLEARMADTIPRTFWAEPVLFYETSKAFFSNDASTRLT